MLRRLRRNPWSAYYGDERALRGWQAALDRCDLLLEALDRIAKGAESNPASAVREVAESAIARDNELRRADPEKVPERGINVVSGIPARGPIPDPGGLPQSNREEKR